MTLHRLSGWILCRRSGDQDAEPLRAPPPTALAESEATWDNSRVFRDAGEAVATLKAEPGRDILVLNSAKLIQSLLAADLADDMRLSVVPGLLGGGLRLLPHGVSGAWDLASSTTLPDGALGVHYQRR